ncbi:MAG TPA: DUF5658 family protein [Phycisphaerales bacterium]
MFREPILYPRGYSWLVVLAVLDVCCTYAILRLGGIELNGIANWFLRMFDLYGLITLKFVCVGLVLMICEVVGRLRATTGTRLVAAAIVISAFPVAVGAGQLAAARLGVIKTNPSITLEPLAWRGVTSSR